MNQPHFGLPLADKLYINSQRHDGLTGLKAHLHNLMEMRFNIQAK